jgi:hypothetical protein
VTPVKVFSNKILSDKETYATAQMVNAIYALFPARKIPHIAIRSHLRKLLHVSKKNMST